MIEKPAHPREAVAPSGSRPGQAAGDAAATSYGLRDGTVGRYGAHQDPDGTEEGRDVLG